MLIVKKKINGCKSTNHLNDEVLRHNVYIYAEIVSDENFLRFS